MPTRASSSAISYGVLCWHGNGPYVGGIWTTLGKIDEEKCPSHLRRGDHLALWGTSRSCARSYRCCHVRRTRVPSRGAKGARRCSNPPFWSLEPPALLVTRSPANSSVMATG